MAVPSRTARSWRNLSVSVLTQIVTVALGFVTRTVFVTALGVELLGVNTLLVSIFAFLAVADLGLNSALMFALYEPLKDRDEQRVRAVVSYATRLYGVVAFAVLVFGVALLPFLDHLVTLDEPLRGLPLYYVVLLTNSVVSYLMVSRKVLLDADQRLYLTRAYSLVFTIIRTAVQVALLLMHPSFLWFLVVQVAFTVLNNLFVYLQAGRLYPYLRTLGPPLSTPERRSIRFSVRSVIVYRLAGLVLGNSTPLLISALIGTVALGYYSNYLLILASVVMITEVAFSALTPSVGNLIAGDEGHAAREVFDEVVLLALLVHGAIGVFLVSFMDDVVGLWLGRDFVLGPSVVIASVLGFYVSGIHMPIWSFRAATGMFRDTQLALVVTVVVSLALAVVLGRVWGLAGVIVAPALARLLTVFWYEPVVLLRRYLGGALAPYFWGHLRAFLAWVLAAVVVLGAGKVFEGELLLAMGMKAVTLVIAVPLAAWLGTGRSPAFRPLKRRMMAVMGR